MPSGKQLSFAFGEVSPALRFRVDASFYAQALSKLDGGYVRKAGGVSNMAGTKLFIPAVNQTNIPAATSKVGIRVFPFTSTGGAKFLFELSGVLHAPLGSDFASPISSIDSSGTTVSMSGHFLDGAGSAELYVYLDLGTAILTQLGDSAIITVDVLSSTGFSSGLEPKQIMILIKYDGSAFAISGELEKPTHVGLSVGIFPTGNSTNGTTASPNLPVSYLATQELTDGSEVLWGGANFTTGHPDPERNTTISIDAQSGPEIKQYNIYRADGPNGHFALVGRISPAGGAVNFTDFLVSPDITVQPPTDDYLYGKGTAYGNRTQIRKVTYYKERAILAYAKFRENGSTLDAYIDGQMGASKMGAPRMFGRPLTPSDFEAFSFTLPMEKIGRITNFLSINRLMVFTDRNAVAIRGGPGGVLTPHQVNPEIIYHEGCAPDITPVALSNFGFFIPPDKSKLLMLTYNRDDSVTCADVSLLSDHLFEAKDIRHMVGVTGQENMIFMLKKDGTLVCLTTSTEGSIQGFSTRKTDGFIEDLCVQNYTTSHYPGDTGIEVPTLVLSVIRNGVRYYERMAVRDDTRPTRYLFADSAKVFGSLPIDPLVNTNTLLNLTAADFTAGHNITVTNVGTTPSFNSGFVGSVYDFFYDIFDTNGVKTGTSKVRLTITGYTSSTILTATCMEDIPLYLRDIASQTLSASDKQYRQAQFIKATKIVTGLTHLANRKVSVYADEKVLSSPNNPNQDTLTVANDGTLDLGDFYDWGYVGLPYDTTIETLNLEASDSRTLADTGKLINRVGLGVRRTLGGFVGQTGIKDLLQMEQIAARSDLSIENPTTAYDGYLTVAFPSDWEPTGRVLIKQVDPLPMSILSVYPKGVIGE